MVVCAMQSYASEQPMNGYNALKSPQTILIKNDDETVDKGNGEDDDREEGEIVDDFEMIISSEDEEFKLRARIRQLEDKSQDIEKMDLMSANLANQYNYHRPHSTKRYTKYQHYSPISVLSDVSSLSADEFEPPKRYRKHKMKRNESKRYGQVLKRNAHTRSHEKQTMLVHQPLHKKRRHDHHNSCNNQYAMQQRRYHHQPQQHQTATILLDSLDSVTEDEIGEYNLNVENESDYEDLERLKVSRDKLRVALGRTANYDIKPKLSLKERLQYRLRKSPSPCPRATETEINPENELPRNSFEGYSQHRSDEEEEEKRQKEQQRLQEETQFEEPAELKLRLIALKSAILKKHMARKKRDAERAYSPTDMINRVHPPTTSNDCDDIDDLMEISPAASPERSAYSPPPPSNFVEPVDMDLVQTDSDEERQQWQGPNWQSATQNSNGWSCFMTNTLPPVSMPIVIDCDEEEEQLLCDDVPPPPPSFHMKFESDDDDARDALQYNERQSQDGSLTDIQSVSMENSETQPFQVDSSDDEAGALRAMLLSKLKPAETEAPKELPTTVIIEQTETRDSDDPEELRLLLLSSIASKKKNCDELTVGVSPEILKNAVRRFQVSALKAEVEHMADETARQDFVAESDQDVVAQPEQAVAPEPEQDVVAQPEQAVAPEPEQDVVAEPEQDVVAQPEQDVVAQPEQDVVAQPEQDLVTELEQYVAAEPEQSSSENSNNLPMYLTLPVSTALPESVPLPVPLPSVYLPVEAPKEASIEAEHKEQSPSPILTLKPVPASPTSSIIKIVKPNKVINKKTAPKRKLSKQSETAPPIKRPTTLLVKEPVAPLHAQNSVSTTRLITTLDPSSIKVKKLVIALAESSAGSDDELELTDCQAYSNYTSYASPISQTLDSASNSTTRSNTPNSEILETAPSNNPNLRRTVINEYFEKKLDDYLKQARSKVITAAPLANNKLTVQPDKTSEQQSPKVTNTVVAAPQIAKSTPVAVRHLPVATQKEYLRLIERMQLLERKKIGTAKVLPKLTQSTQTTSIIKVKAKTNAAVTINRKLVKNVTSAALESKNNINVSATNATATAAPSKTELPKKSAQLASTSTAATNASQPSKQSRLTAFETSFLKIGASMITNLDKSLLMVEEAKRSKILRLRYAQRLKALYSEMQSIKQAVKLEESKLVRIQPEIQASHEIIISHKQRRNNLRKAAMDLGRDIKGADYRLLDPGKSEISRKSTQLTKEIRYYNALHKFEDIAQQQNQENLHKMESKSVPEPMTQTQSSKVPEAPTKTTSSEITDSHPSVDEKQALQQEEQPFECVFPDATTVQPVDVDTVPQNDAAHATKSNVPLYNVSHMRQLWKLPCSDSLLSEYRSSMPHNYNSKLDVNATVCPFDLMGRCEDADCSYLHLTRLEETAASVSDSVSATTTH